MTAVDISTPSGTIRPMVPVASPIGGSSDMLANPALFEHMQRVAKMFMKSSLIPDHLKKNDGADAFLALQIARDRGESPVAVMQNIFFISGRAGWMTNYMIGRANKSGAFTGRIKWKVEGAGETLKVTAYATDAESGEVLDAWVDWAMAKAEGWIKNPKYQSMPEHMLKWRAAAFLIRLYCPEVMHGMHTVDELDDMAASGQLKDITPEGRVTTADKVAAALQDEALANDPNYRPIDEPDRRNILDTSLEPPPARPAKSWDVRPQQPGEEPKRLAIIELLELAETEAEVDDIERWHQEFLSKLNRTKSATRDAFRVRKITLSTAPRPAA